MGPTEVVTYEEEAALQKRKLLQLQIETAESNKKAAAENARIALQNGRLADAKAGQAEEELRIRADALAIEREKQAIEREKQAIKRKKQEADASSFNHSTGVPLLVSRVVELVFGDEYDKNLNKWVGAVAAAKFRELYKQEPPRKTGGKYSSAAYTENHRVLLEAAANECKAAYDVSGIPERFL
eukprot:78367-Rhodomonas_salina.1